MNVRTATCNDSAIVGCNRRRYGLSIAPHTTPTEITTIEICRCSVALELL